MTSPALRDALAALEPFAEVINWLGRLRELDRDAQLSANNPIHANGPGSGGSCNVPPEAFHNAYKAAIKLRAILSRANSSDVSVPREMWQPIETAPKDGREILLFAKRQYVGRWAHTNYHEALRGPVTGWFLDYNCQHNIEPSHWQPLSASPHSALQSGKPSP